MSIKRNRRGEIKTSRLTDSELSSELQRAGDAENRAYNRVFSPGRDQSSPQFLDDYDDWAEKYWEKKRLQQEDDDRFDSGGCLMVLVYLFIIAFVFYWVVKGLFSIRYW